jgi:hypothetical protein
VLSQATLLRVNELVHQELLKRQDQETEATSQDFAQPTQLIPSDL